MQLHVIHIWVEPKRALQWLSVLYTYLFEAIRLTTEPGPGPHSRKNSNTRQLPGMRTMLEHFHLSLNGRHHSGIYDSKNIANILIKLLEVSPFAVQPT